MKYIVLVVQHTQSLALLIHTLSQFNRQQRRIYVMACDCMRWNTKRKTLKPGHIATVTTFSVPRESTHIILNIFSNQNRSYTNSLPALFFSPCIGFRFVLLLLLDNILDGTVKRHMIETPFYVDGGVGLFFGFISIVREEWRRKNHEIYSDSAMNLDLCESNVASLTVTITSEFSLNNKNKYGWLTEKQAQFIHSIQIQFIQTPFSMDCFQLFEIV